MPPQPAVIVMVKAPTPGTVKTRLTPPLSAEAAAELTAAFVQDTVANVRRMGAAVVIACAPDDGRSILEAILPGGLFWTAQRGSDLGERMGGAMADAEAFGFGPLAVIGTDSPSLPPGFITEALVALQSDAADVVLGPTDDGGYYLVGTRQPAAGLFNCVAWSTDRVFAQTAANAERLGLRRLLSLPPWYDIDTISDLQRLRRELADPAVRDRLLATMTWFERHPAISPR